jgi:hypothetical protein
MTFSPKEGIMKRIIWDGIAVVLVLVPCAALAQTAPANNPSNPFDCDVTNVAALEGLTVVAALAELRHACGNSFRYDAQTTALEGQLVQGQLADGPVDEVISYILEPIPGIDHDIESDPSVLVIRDIVPQAYVAPPPELPQLATAVPSPMPSTPTPVDCRQTQGIMAFNDCVYEQGLQRTAWMQATYWRPGYDAYGFGPSMPIGEVNQVGGIYDLQGMGLYGFPYFWDVFYEDAHRGLRDRWQTTSIKVEGRKDRSGRNANEDFMEDLDILVILENSGGRIRPFYLAGPATSNNWHDDPIDVPLDDDGTALLILVQKPTGKTKVHPMWVRGRGVRNEKAVPISILPSDFDNGRQLVDVLNAFGIELPL